MLGVRFSDYYEPFAWCQTSCMRAQGVTPSVKCFHVERNLVMGGHSHLLVLSKSKRCLIPQVI